MFTLNFAGRSLSLYDFKEWRKAKIKELEESLENEDHVDCPECEGSGEAECYACGHETTCEECGGDGTIPASEVEPHRMFSNIKEYNADQLRLITQYCQHQNISFEEAMQAWKTISSNVKSGNVKETSDEFVQGRL